MCLLKGLPNVWEMFEVLFWLFFSLKRRIAGISPPANRSALWHKTPHLGKRVGARAELFLVAI